MIYQHKQISRWLSGGICHKHQYYRFHEQLSYHNAYFYILLIVYCHVIIKPFFMNIFLNSSILMTLCNFYLFILLIFSIYIIFILYYKIYLLILKYLRLFKLLINFFCSWFYSLLSILLFFFFLLLYFILFILLLFS